MPDTSRPHSTPSGATDVGRRWLRTDNVLLASALALFVWFTGDVLLLVSAGLLLAVGLDGFANWLKDKTPLSHGWSLLVVVILSIAFLALIGMTVVPQFLGELDQLWERLNQFVRQAQDTLSRYDWAQQLLSDGEGQSRAADAASALARQAASAMLAITGVLSSIVILLAIALFAAADPALYRRGLLVLVPPRHRARIGETLSTIGHVLRWWFLAQFVSMLVLGVTMAIGLWIIGIDLWLSLGVLTGVLTFIPFLGPIIAGVPIIIVGFAEGLQTGLIVLAFFLVAQNLEGSVLSPMIQQRVADLPPVLGIAVQVLMSALFGAMGLIMAAPLTLVGMVVVRKLYVEDTLGEPKSSP